MLPPHVAATAVAAATIGCTFILTTCVYNNEIKTKSSARNLHLELNQMQFACRKEAKGNERNENGNGAQQINKIPKPNAFFAQFYKYLIAIALHEFVCVYNRVANICNIRA